MKGKLAQISDQQMQDRVLRVLADLYYNSYHITWDQLLPIILFLKENKAYGPKGIDVIITQLCKINIRLLSFLGENTNDFLTEKKQESMLHFLNHSSVWKEKIDAMDDYKNGDRSIEKVGIGSILLENKGSYYTFKSLGDMVGRKHYPMFDSIARDFSVVREFLGKNRTSIHSFVFRNANISLHQAEVLQAMGANDFDSTQLQESYSVLKQSLQKNDYEKPSVIESIQLNNEDSWIKEIYCSTLCLEAYVKNYQSFLSASKTKFAKLKQRLLWIKERLERTCEQTTDLEQKFYLRCYLGIINQALETNDVNKMEQISSIIKVKKKEINKEKLA